MGGQPPKKPVRKMKNYTHKNTREKFAENKRETVREAYKCNRKWIGEQRQKDPYFKSSDYRFVYFTGNHTAVCVTDSSEASDMSDCRTYYDEKFPTKKDIIGEINMGLDHIQQDVKCGCAPYGFEVILDAALYAYDSPRSKLEGEEAEPPGDHSACVILATLTAEDVARELKEKETEEANRLTQRFCADPTFDALCTRYPTLRLDPYDPHSSDYRDMVKLRKLYEERTGKPAFQ